MIQIHGIDHLVLRTENLPAMLTFYCEVLGCVVERQLAPEVGLTQLRAGNALIDLVTVDSNLGRLAGDAPDPQRPNLDHFCLQLVDFDEDALRAHLAQHGITASPLEERYGAQGNGPSMYLKDPDQNTVELKGRLVLDD